MFRIEKGRMLDDKDGISCVRRKDDRKGASF